MSTLTKNNVTYDMIAPFILAMEKRVERGTEQHLDRLPVAAKKAITAALKDVQTIDGERILTAERYHFLCEEDGLKAAYVTYREVKAKSDEREAERRRYAKEALKPVKRKATRF